MLRRNVFFVSLIVIVFLSTARSALALPANQPAQSNEVTATNGIYDIFVNSDGYGVGTYTVRTSMNHPVTITMGNPQSVLFGGSGGAPGTSFNTIRSYETNTDYVQGGYKTSNFTVINLDAYSTGTIPLGSTGIRTTWDLPGPPTTPDKLNITQDIEIIGTTFLDSYVKVKLQVTNPNFSSVDLGVRYLWDLEIGVDDGPVFTQQYPSGSTLTSEIEFQPPEFVSYHIQDNDQNPNPPIFSVYGSATPPSGLDFPRGPDVLQFVDWTTAYNTAFDYTVNPNEEIGINFGDSAVNYIFGPDATTALRAGSNETLTLVASIGAIPMDSDKDGLVDIWETNDTDLNGDGVIDIGPSVGADPNRKDIYVEVDWMEDGSHSHKPMDVAIEKIVDAFAAHDINLHVDSGPESIDYVTGNLWGENSNGNAVAHEDILTPINWESIITTNFGHSDRVYRHALFVHKAYDKSLGQTNIQSSQHFFVALGTKKDSIGTINEQAGVFMHELGHTLNLWHGGSVDQKYDNFHFKPNYLSVMNYNFTTSGLIINGTDGHFDYSNFDLPDLDETQLFETDGLNDNRVSDYSLEFRVQSTLTRSGTC